MPTDTRSCNGSQQHDQGELVSGPRHETGVGAGLTVREVARRYRVGEDKVRGWIARCELKAINTATALCGRPRWVIPAEALVNFEKGRTSTPVPKPTRRRRRSQEIDFYPD
jgi:transposase